MDLSTASRSSWKMNNKGTKAVNDAASVLLLQRQVAALFRRGP
jgi:hypothetical protein